LQTPVDRPGEPRRSAQSPGDHPETTLCWLFSLFVAAK
jgi:hypothetical protein